MLKLTLITLVILVVAIAALSLVPLGKPKLKDMADILLELLIMILAILLGAIVLYLPASIIPM
jgi:hypothetical protein